MEVISLKQTVVKKILNIFLDDEYLILFHTIHGPYHLYDLVTANKVISFHPNNLDAFIVFSYLMYKGWLVSLQQEKNLQKDKLYLFFPFTHKTYKIDFAFYSHISGKFCPETLKSSFIFYDNGKIIVCDNIPGQNVNFDYFELKVKPGKLLAKAFNYDIESCFLFENNCYLIINPNRLNDYLYTFKPNDKLHDFFFKEE